MMTETRPSKTSTRTCAGCGGKGAPGAMARVVRGPGGELAVDLAGGAFGRGAHVHPACIDAACKGGFARALRAAVRADAGELRAQLREAVTRRVAGLLLGARRARAVAVGADAACEALRAGAFAVVARDAGSVAQKDEVTRAVAEGRAVSFGDKATLGALMGQTEIAVVALTRAEFARAVGQCIALAGA